jgi:hypothetical protein
MIPGVDYCVVVAGAEACVPGCRRVAAANQLQASPEARANCDHRQPGSQSQAALMPAQSIAAPHLPSRRRALSSQSPVKSAHALAAYLHPSHLCCDGQASRHISKRPPKRRRPRFCLWLTKTLGTVSSPHGRSQLASFALTASRFVSSYCCPLVLGPTSASDSDRREDTDKGAQGTHVSTCGDSGPKTTL